MPISTNLRRAQMGTFGIMIAKLYVINNWSSITKAKFQKSFFFLITFLSCLLILSNDVDLNPGWNLNSIADQNFVKLSQLEAYNTLHSYDLICLRHS